jgi:uncharacterized phage protein (TIGR01671 family)
MREIKFRVWSNQLNKMVYPNERGWFDKCFIGKNQFIQSCQLSLAIEKNGKELEVMQFTGLKDRNGREVYEGDVIAVSEALYTSFGRIPTGDYIEYYAKIIWMKDGWGYRVLKNEHAYGPVVGSETKGIDEILKYGEVIGSIYEVQELLEVQHD